MAPQCFLTIVLPSASVPGDADDGEMGVAGDVTQTHRYQAAIYKARPTPQEVEGEKEEEEEEEEEEEQEHDDESEQQEAQGTGAVAPWTAEAGEDFYAQSRPCISQMTSDLRAISCCCICITVNIVSLGYLIMALAELWPEPLLLEYHFPLCSLHVADFATRLRRGARGSDYYWHLEGSVILMGIVGVVRYALCSDEYAYIHYLTLLKTPLDTQRLLTTIHKRSET
eukprot:TRINITY_DN3688_c1_g3_i1.p1 TRINITY_DN3688_c1_g3~~TRINITY_DN3688_c1_g3_i1.p1  ORF type:complete len:226 (-),score=31.87 TRINITY_DN3688_c1_g3_i1:785-1462(-)